MKYRSFSIAILAAIAVLVGCRNVEVLPPVLPVGAPRDQIVGVVNANTARVQSVWITRAELSVPGVPTLPVNIALQPPLRFRMRASTALTGPEIDLGSNDELFWFWIRRNQPPALFFCRHDQFAASAARQIMPIEPQFIVEAMGLVRFDPSEQLQGPFPVGAGRVQIRSIRHDPLGDLTKITVIDSLRGVVLEQHLYDAAGRRLASAIMDQHHRDPLSGAILPKHIEIQYPGSQMSLAIDIRDMQVNILGPESAQLWTKPEYSGYPNVNLADPNLQFAQPGGPMPGSPIPGAAMPGVVQPGMAPPGFAPQQPGPAPIVPQSPPLGATSFGR